MITKIMRTIQYCGNLHAASGDRGERLQGAAIGKGEALIVETPDFDHWSHIVGPSEIINPDGTYLSYGLPAWVETAHLEDINADKQRFTIEVDYTNRTVRFV